MKNRTHRTTLAALVLTAGLLTVSPAYAADPEPIPPTCGENEPCPEPPCDPQTVLNLNQQLLVERARVEHLRERVERRGLAIARLRARLHHGWS